MTKKIPTIDDLTDGINDADIINEAVHTSKQPDATSTGKEPTTVATPPDTDTPNIDRCWQDFLSRLEEPGNNEEKAERLVCKLDRDLADSLDECDIHNRSRSDLVNAIVRSFFGIYLGRLLPFRREKKSLFSTCKPA